MGAKSQPFCFSFAEQAEVFPMKNIDHYSDKGLAIVIGSPIDYDNLVAYIRVDGKQICLLQQEEGKNKFKIEFNTHSAEVVVDFDLFLRGLEEAKQCLLQ